MYRRFDHYEINVLQYFYKVVNKIKKIIILLKKKGFIKYIKLEK